MSRNLILILLSSIIALSCTSCSEEGLTIRFTIPLKGFTVNADKLCNDECKKIPSGLSMQDIGGEVFEQVIPVDLLKAAGNNADTLNRYKDSINTIAIEKLDYTVANTLPFKTPPVSVYADNSGVKGKTENSAIFFQFPSINKNTTQRTDNFKPTKTEKRKVSNIFKSLNFVVIPHFKPVIPKGTQFPIRGQFELTNVKAHVLISFDVLKAGAAGIKQGFDSIRGK